MSTPRFIRKMAILAVTETVYGTLVVPTAVDAMEVSNVNLVPIEGEEVDEEIMRPFFGASETALVTLYRSISFSVGLAGVGTAGALPGYTALMRACSANVTNTPGPSASAGTVFAPVTEGAESITIYAVIDKQLYKMGGVRGNCKAVVDAKKIPKWTFDFTGAFFPVEDLASMPAVNYTKFQRPLGVNKLNTTLSLDGFNAAASAFSFDFGNQVEKQDLMNWDAAEITGRTSTASVTFRNTSVATKNWIEMARARAKVPLLLKHGQAATNTVSIAAARAQIGKPSFGEEQGVQMITVPLRLIPSDLGNDEWSITV